MNWSYTNRLHGQSVLLIGGSVPEVWDRDNRDFEIEVEDELDLRVEEAVMALARAVFIRGGQLALVHSELLTPLVLEVFRDYWVPPAPETNSQEREPVDSHTAPLLILAEDEHRAELVDYRYAVGRYAAVQGVSLLDRRGFFRSICIGGDDRAQRIAESVKAERRVVIASTGGAAFELTRRDWENPEAAMLASITRMRREIKSSPPEDQRRGEREPGNESWPDFRYAVYPLLMAEILDSQPIPSFG